MNHSFAQACIEACNTCAVMCERCAAACLHEQDVGAMAHCIALDLDCAQICRTSAAFMARDSRHAADLCALCADLCDDCGEECASHSMDHCRDCAQACRACAEACRQMAGYSSQSGVDLQSVPAH